MTEWRDIPGYEGRYQASDHGQIRSLSRRVATHHGGSRMLPGRILRQCRASNGRLCVTLYPSAVRQLTHSVHRLVAEAFLADSYFVGAEVCHGDGDGDNNHVDNLRWDTKSANQLDRLKHGRHHCAAKTHCLYGHPFSEENTRLVLSKNGRFHRRCRTCSQTRETIRTEKRRQMRLALAAVS